MMVTKMTRIRLEKTCNKRNTLKIILGLLLLVIVVGGIVLVFNPDDKNTIEKRTQKEETLKIGVILPLSGPLANFGTDIANGIQLFAEAHPDIKVILEDDKFEPKQSLLAYKKLKEVNNVDFFIGPLGPVAVETIYASMTDKEKQETLLLPFSLCVDAFKKYENMLCTYPGLDKQIENSVKFIKSKGKANVYVVTENTPMGSLAEEIFRAKADELGIDVIGVEKIDFATQKTYYTYVTKINARDPEAVYFISASPAANFVFVREMKEQNINTLIVTNLDVEEDHLKKFEDALEGVYFSGFISDVYEAEFTNLFKTKYGKTPNLYNAGGYELATLIYKVKNAKAKDLNLKQSVMFYQNKYDFAIPEMTYDSEAMIETPFETKQVIDGELVAVPE